MTRWLAIAAFVLVAAPLHAQSISGQYLEARTADVWTGPCFANAEMSLSGKQAVLAWKVEKGTVDDVRLDGLAVVALVLTSDTLGTEQTGPGRALLIVDERADEAQRAALVKLARSQAGKLLDRVVAVQAAGVEMKVGGCKEGGCARLKAGAATLTTRCLDDHHDKVCGNEAAFYPPLVKGVQAEAAVASEFSFTGKGLNGTWKEAERRGAYVGTFAIK